jgi:hypothetical protein
LISEEIKEKYGDASHFFRTEAKRLHKRAISRKKLILNPQKADES